MMFTIPEGHYLGRTGLDVLVDEFRHSLTRPIEDDQVQYSVDAVNSKLKIRALDITSLGELGKFDGEFLWPYTKVSLETVLPYPLLCVIPYPTTFRQICGFLKQRYGLLLEEDELATTVNGPGLKMVDEVNALLNPSNGTLRLFAKPTSARFLAGSSLFLTVANPLGPIRLNAIIGSSEPLNLSVLTDVA